MKNTLKEFGNPSSERPAAEPTERERRLVAEILAHMAYIGMAENGKHMEKVRGLGMALTCAREILGGVSMEFMETEILAAGGNGEHCKQTIQWAREFSGIDPSADPDPVPDSVVH